MSKLPYMKLWVNDFLADTRRLNATELGAYMALLFEQWKLKGESLPPDQGELKDIARVGRNWPKVWAKIERYFELDEEGYFNSRIRSEYKVGRTKSDKAKQSGSLGGKAKALKNKKTGLANAKKTLERKCSPPKPELYNPPNPPEIEDKSQEIFDRWRQLAEREGTPKPRDLSDDLKRQINARIKEHGMDAWSEVMAVVENSDFLRGRTKPTDGRGPFSLTLIWVARKSNFVKILEGFYGRPRPTNVTPLPANWPARISAYRSNGIWQSNWGPKPGEEGCQCPPKLLEPSKQGAML